MTLDEFRANGALVAEWHEVLRMPITQIVLNIAEQEAPWNRVIKSDITPTFASVRLGHDAGWAEHDKFITETVLITPQNREQIEPTYEDPEKKRNSLCLNQR